MKLRWYQQEAVDSIFNSFDKRLGNPLVQLPTGTGKSLIPPAFIYRALMQYPGLRFIVATHVKELVRQNYEEMLEYWQLAPAGIYSAGLDRRDIALPIIFGGIASMYRVAAQFGKIDVLFIDEAHLLSPDDETMYQTFIKVLRQANPNLVICGLSATGFRQGLGSLTNNGIFNHISYDLCTVDGFNRLLAEGYLAPLISKRPGVRMDTSGFHMSNGDYVKSEAEAEANRILLSALQEFCAYGQNRYCWMIFAAGTENSDRIADVLTSWGFPSASVHSKKKAKENDKAIEAFKDKELRCLVNYGKLTTGFNHKPIDHIGLFRATTSSSLHVQILGRGTRPVYARGYDLDTVEGRLASIAASQKQDCLVMDFAGNLARLGPINDPLKPKEKGQSSGDVPIRICDSSVAEMLDAQGNKYFGCDAYNHASARVCCQCFLHFPPPKIKYEDSASTEEVMRGSQQHVANVKLFDVSQVFYSKHFKAQGSSLKVQYKCGLRTFDQYVPIEHATASKLARDWWRMRFPMQEGQEPPKTVDEALTLVSNLKSPARIRVDVAKKHPEIIGHEF